MGFFYYLNMIFRNFFFVTLFISSLNIFSQNKISVKDSLSIMKVMSFQQDAWNQGDIDSFMEGYLKSDELVFSGKSGPVYGWENTKNRYYSSYPNTKVMGKLNFTIKKMKFTPEQFKKIQEKSRIIFGGRCKECH